MKEYLNILRGCPLFEGTQEAELEAMLGCLGAKEACYNKGDAVFSEGEPAKYLGIVLTGRVQTERVDYYGNRSILTCAQPPQIFGEAFACAGLTALPVAVVAAEKTRVLLIEAVRITQTCAHACSFHNRMIFNLLNTVAKKNLVFHQKIEITSKRSTREKLMTYLLLEAKNNGGSTFTIPYNRQELADYLEVERSGLCAEISKLRRENILECKKNSFALLQGSK